MVNQTQISKIFEVHSSEISRMLNVDPNKRRQPTYSFALKLKSYLGGGVEEWIEVGRGTLVSAFELILESKAQEKVAS